MGESPLRDARDRLQRRESRPQGLLPDGGQAVRVATVVALETNNQSPRFQAGDRAVERARPEADARHLFDVVRHRIPVLRALGKADEDHEGRFGEPAEVVELVLLPRHYYASRNTFGVILRQT